MGIAREWYVKYEIKRHHLISLVLLLMFFINVSLPLFMRHCLSHLLFHMYFLTMHSKNVYASDIYTVYIIIWICRLCVYVQTYNNTYISKFWFISLYLECRWTKVNHRFVVTYHGLLISFERILAESFKTKSFLYDSSKNTFGMLTN